MTQGERVKEIRKALNLTLENFGLKLGVTKTAISRIEKGERNLTDQMTLSICREFNVNEIWLRTGEGSMFLELNRNEKISLWVSKITKEPVSEFDDFKIRFIEVLSKLDADAWKGIEQFGYALLEKKKDEPEG